MNCYFHPEIIACDQCSSCGKKICHLCREEAESKIYCKECFEKKYPVQKTAENPVPENNIAEPPKKIKYNDLAIVSFSLAIGSIFLHLLAAIPAIVTGIIARKQLKNSETPQKGDEFALAGIIIGSIFTALWSSVICVYASIYGSFFLTLCSAGLSGMFD